MVWVSSCINQTILAGVVHVLSYKLSFESAFKRSDFILSSVFVII